MIAAAAGFGDSGLRAGHQAQTQGQTKCKRSGGIFHLVLPKGNSRDFSLCATGWQKIMAPA